MVIALTIFESGELVLRARRAGAARFLVKSTPPEDSWGSSASQPTARRCSHRSRRERLLAAWGDGGAARARARKLVAGFAERESDVLGCLGAGATTRRSVAPLSSEATVKGYVSRILVQLDCANRTRAGLLADDAGVVRSTG